MHRPSQLLVSGIVGERQPSPRLDDLLAPPTAPLRPLDELAVLGGLVRPVERVERQCNAAVGQSELARVEQALVLRDVEDQIGQDRDCACSACGLDGRTRTVHVQRLGRQRLTPGVRKDADA